MNITKQLANRTEAIRKSQAALGTRGAWDPSVAAMEPIEIRVKRGDDPSAALQRIGESGWMIAGADVDASTGDIRYRAILKQPRRLREQAAA